MGFGLVGIAIRGSGHGGALSIGLSEYLEPSPELLGAFYVLLTGPMILVVYEALQHREEPAGLPLAVALAATSCWSFVYGVGLIVPHEGVTVGANVLRNAFTSVATIAWFYVAVEYTNTNWLERRSILTVLSLEPVLVSVLGVTNGYHHLVWTSGTTITPAGVLEPEFGVFFFLHAAFTWVLLLASAVLLVRKFRTARGVYRKQTAALLVGMAISWLGAILFVTGSVPVDYLDTGPIGVSIGGIVFLQALFHYEFLEVAPVARETLMENMADAVVALDSEDRIIDINTRARDVFGVDDDVVGRPIESVFPEYSSLVSPDGSGRTDDQGRTDGDAVRSGGSSDPRRADTGGNATRDRYELAPGFTRESELRFETDRGERHFHLNVSPLEGQGRELGQLVVLRDVTTLKDHEADLELLNQLFGRILRHNIRNDLNVVRAHGRELAERDDEDLAEVGQLIAEKSHGVVELSEKARKIERLVESDRRTTTLDLEATVTGLVESYRPIYTDVAFEAAVERACVVEVPRALEIAIENLVQNAAEHNDGPDPHVSVSVDCTESAATVAVTDDGPGIPDQELDVLKRREETQIRHGSGIGLWFVDWAIRESSATIDFDTGPEGTTITVTIPR